jgi:hypothetical protein
MGIGRLLIVEGPEQSLLSFASETVLRRQRLRRDPDHFIV